MISAPVPILLIHAFPLDSRMWRPQFEAFTPAVRVLAPDLRGFGRNLRGPLFESVDQHAKNLVTLLDHASAPRALVVGLSMGGYVALALTRRHPHRVAGLLLANTRAEPDDPAEQAQRDAMIEQVRSVGTSLLPNAMLPRLVAPDCDDPTRNFLRGLMLEQNPAGVEAALMALRNRPDARGGLFQIHCPTALICGEHDGLTPPSIMQLLADAIPGATLTVAPGAGHLTNLEAPAVFNQVLADLHDRVRRGMRLG
ncbi:MAG: alpha/beta fold hydrolase [Myxococcota bacterium]